MDSFGIQWIFILLLVIIFAYGVKKNWGWPALLFTAFILFALFFATDLGAWMLEKLQYVQSSFGDAEVTDGG